MPSERVQRRIDRLLDRIDQADDAEDWTRVRDLSSDVLDIDSDNQEATAYLRSANRRLGVEPDSAPNGSTSPKTVTPASSVSPASFASGRYTVSKFLGEGGKKKVYLAHDNTLDRNVAFALIKTEGLDETSRERVKREAQAMGRMGTHPCIMPIYDLGEENGQPYMVQPVMVGGDVEGLVEEAEGPLDLDRAITIATQTAQGLSFAHGKGIVHRDLKPGNVWLDEDGAAKIGDFGLAVATDRSRLTVEKVMVGTVSYMPPEQATGGEVTPRADLYSLGAMLYEMCTGRVPFMGDDDIGIISQHINTPPVAPSWHNNQIPKTLDSLILRLLAKDPAERPFDADELLVALKSVDLTAVEEREEESKGSLDSMAGGVFVGRHREMDQLKSIFEDVLSGRGRMVTLVGEPGIGKTRTAQELATYAGMRGAEVLWGRSYESGGAPPYWPWVQAIRSQVAATEPQELRDQLGATAPVIAEVVSEIKSKLPDIPPPIPIEDSESARFRLFDSVSTFLKQVSSASPLVLMLEDLHWSDKPSLMLLEFVARELANSRILIVGNYRDMELNRRHPLSVTLGDLTRERLFERVLLRGLQRHDVERFIEIAAGVAPPAALVDTVHSQTEGNPLFVTETVRLLIQEGDITSGQTSKGGTTSWEIRIPEGVREVIGRRLDRLSERCNEVLTTAAVMGRRFRFPVLLKLSDDVTDNMLLDVMDEAASARVIEELPEDVGLYQFTHALMQETLTSELSANRTVRMHARIAKALEEHYDEDTVSHSPELAEHFIEAETIHGSDPIIKYCGMAGEQYFTGHAYEAAAECFSTALQHTKKDDLQNFGHLQFGLGRALLNTAGRDEMQDVVDALVAGFDAFTRLGDSETALQIALHPIPNVQGSKGLVQMLEQALPMTKHDQAAKANILVSLARWRSFENYDPDGSVRAADTALDIAIRLSDKELEFRALSEKHTLLMHSGFASKTILFSEENIQMSERLEELSNSVNLPTAETAFYHVQGFAELTRGRLDKAQRYFERQREAAERSHNRWEMATALANSAYPYILIGDWDTAMKMAEEGLLLSPDEKRLFAVRYYCLVESGQFEQITGILKNLTLHEITLGGSYIMNKDYFTDEQVGEARNQTNDKRVVEGRSLASRRWSQLGFLSAIRGDNEGAKEAFDNLPDYEQTPSDIRLLMSIRSIMSEIASAAGEPETALTFIKGARLEAQEASHAPQKGWTAFQLSNLLLERNEPGDHEKATELQDEAISIATELGMKPLLERVLAKREILKA